VKNIDKTWISKTRIPETAQMKEWTLEESMDFLSNYYYQFARIFEMFEIAGLIWGNGHHIAQYLSAEACKLLKERWIGK